MLSDPPTSDRQAQSTNSWGSRHQYLLAAAAVFLLTRVVSLIGAYFAVSRGETPAGLAMSLIQFGDGEWYQDIVTGGYDSTETLSPELRAACPDDSVAGCLPGAPDRHSNLAFFPLLPALIRALSSVGFGPGEAALLVAGTTSVLAAVLIAVLARDFAGPRFGLVAVALWGCWPANIVLSSGRPEPLFVALASGALLLATRGRLLWAAGAAAVAGLARFQATAVIVPVVLTAWQVAFRSRDCRVAAIVTAVAPTGLVVALGYLGLRAGSLVGWFDVQQEWGSTSDLGASKLQYVLDNLWGDVAVHQVAAWTLVVACLLFVAGMLIKIPWQLSTYSGILLAGVLVQSMYHHHSMRFLLVAFPLVFPVAWLLRRSPWWVAAPTLAVMAVLSAVFQMQMWRSGFF